MFGLFKRESGGDNREPSLNSVKFHTAGYEFRGDIQPYQDRAWYTPEGDGLGLYFFALPPDLPGNRNSTDELADFYRKMLDDSGGGLVEFELLEADGCPALRTILSVPQKPSGRTYVGSLTIPFRDFSFVIKCQCAEHGMTGVKAALLFDRFMAENEDDESLDFAALTFPIPGFNPNDLKHDQEFPNDPVARVRRVLNHIVTTIAVSDTVKQLHKFALP